MALKVQALDFHKNKVMDQHEDMDQQQNNSFIIFFINFLTSLANLQDHEIFPVV